MASKYDVFYVIAKRGEVRITDIVQILNKTKKEYQGIFNKVVKLEAEGYVKRAETVSVIQNEKTKRLYQMIAFCIKNGINYNLMFRKFMLQFLQKAAQKEFFTRKDVPAHGDTFNFYTTALSRYGFLLISSRKPLKCKLLRHHFIQDLLDFFDLTVRFYIPKDHAYMLQIEKEFRKYKRNLKIHKIAVENLEKKEEVNFIHMSLSLEGNPITLSDTQKLIKEDIVPKRYNLIHVQEVTNYKKAVDLMMSNAKKEVKLDLPLILKYHQLAMDHIHGAGEIRKQNVRIKSNPNFKTSDWQLIPQKLGHLMDRYEEFENSKKEVMEIINFAAFFHNELQRIHPFIDGNSRTARLLMLHILRRYELPVLDLPLGYFDLYMDLTKKSKKRDDKAFQHLIEEIVFFNLRGVNSVGYS